MSKKKMEIPTSADWIAQLREFLPVEVEYAEDWVPFRDDDGKWKKESPSFAAHLVDGLVEIEAWAYRYDDWEVDGSFVEGSSEEEWESFYTTYLDRSGDAAEWEKYYRWVAEHGEDPLEEFWVARFVKETETHRVRLIESKGHLWIEGHDKLPFEARQFLNWDHPDRSYVGDGIDSLNQLTGGDTYTIEGDVVTFTTEKKTPRPEKDVKADIIAAAKRALGKEA